jgi:hypothetical protein
MQRTIFIAAMAVALMTVSGALAQGNAGFSVGDLHATHEVLQKRANTTSMLEAPGSPFAQLSKVNRTWIREETKRQAASPRAVIEVLADVDKTLADDAKDLSRKHRIDPFDVTRVVTLLIMADAEDDAHKALKRARKAGDPQAQAAAQVRLDEATARRKEAVEFQSSVSMALAAM